MGLKEKPIAIDCLVVQQQVARPIDWKNIFGADRPLRVEIGSGDGDYLLRSAQQESQSHWIGIEQEWERIKKTLRKVELARGKISAGVPLNNIRVLKVDVRLALERLFVPLSVEKFFCLFPCPWPKNRHVKHRLFSPEFLRLANSRLVDGGEIKIVTDFRPFVQWVLEQIPQTGFSWTQEITAPRFATKFERKWCSQGQQEFYELSLRKTQHVDVPLEEDAVLQFYYVKDFFWERFAFQDLVGQPAVLLKESLFDREHEKVMLRVIVAEKHITQQVWIMIVRCPQGWCIAKAPGSAIIPTPGVAKAILLVAEAAGRSSASTFWASDDPAQAE